MKNIYAMMTRVDVLDEIREYKRMEAAKALQNGIATFVAHYGYASTDKCPSTWRTYVLLREGLILRKKEDEEEGETITTKDLSLPEMEFLREYMEGVIVNDIQYQEDEIDRYIDLYQ